MELEKYKSRRIRMALRRVLMQQWDPIGVADEPMAADEYDSYLGDVFELLKRSAAAHEIRDYLWTIETVNMGLVDASGVAFITPEKLAHAVEELQRVFHEEMLLD